MTIDSREKLSSGALIGIIAAGIFIATFAFMGLFFYVETHRKRKSGKVVPIAADMDMDSRYSETQSKIPNLALNIEELELSSLGGDVKDDEDDADNALEIMEETWITDMGNADSQVPALDPIDNSFMYFDPHSQNRSRAPTDGNYISDDVSIKYAVKDGSQPSVNRKTVLTKFPNKRI